MGLSTGAVSQASNKMARTKAEVVSSAADPVRADPSPQDKATMRAKFIRYGVMMLPDDPLHADPVNAIDGNMLADALDLINVPDTWDASLALTSVQGKRKRMIENNEADQDEYMVATVILSQEIKVQRQRRRIAKLESALLQLRESTVLAYERMIAEDT